MTAQIYESDVRDFIIYVPPDDSQRELGDRFRELVREIRDTESRYHELIDDLGTFDLQV